DEARLWEKSDAGSEASEARSRGSGVGVPQREPCLGTPTPYPSPQGGGVKITASEYQNPLLLFPANHRLNAPNLPRKRGRFANVTNVGAGCGGRWPRRRARKRADVRRELAPVKPCGPDAPRAGVKFSSSSRCLGAMVSKSRS